MTKLDIQTILGSLSPEIEQAADLARVVVDALSCDEDTEIEITTGRLIGVSSSFFNLFYIQVSESLSSKALDRISFKSNAPSLLEIIKRSKEAVAERFDAA